MKLAKKRIVVALCLLTLAVVVVGVTAFFFSLFYVQMEVRDTIRGYVAGTKYYQFALESKEVSKVNRDDQFFFFRYTCGFFSPRKPMLDGIGGISLREFPAVTSNIYIAVGADWPMRLMEVKINQIPYLNGMSNVNVFIVGELKGDPSVKVCEKWPGSFSAMRFAGRRVDCSVLDTLFYASPCEVNPLVQILAVKLLIRNPTPHDWKWSWTRGEGLTFTRNHPQRPFCEYPAE